jgi:cyclopropane-fatty-acyl-phospholipid synthase
MTHSEKARKTALFNSVFRGYEGPAFAVRLWDGLRWSSSANERPVFTIVLENPRALSALLCHPDELSLGEAYIHGDLEVEGDLFSAFSMAEHLFNRPRRLRQQIAEKFATSVFAMGQLFRHGAMNSTRRDRASISYHYDQPVAFFEPWLDRSLAYSCAYFQTREDSLDAAQEQKLELICRKLRLQPGERFLDIGCGWGSLALHAATRHDALVHGITLSREQAETAKRRTERHGLNGRCVTELRDYRELADGQQSFDKIASVGMFEHVGLKNLPQYFGIAHRLLRPGGLFLNHGIARSSLSPMRDNSFIARYVFPDGKLVTLAETLHAAESQGLEVRDVENLREHYEMTLRLWVERLRQNAETLLELVPRITYRIWLLYLAGSAAAFARGDIGLYQVLLSRPDQGISGLPLTREDLYAPSSRRQEVGV